MRASFQELSRFCEQVFTKKGLTKDAIKVATDVIISADLRGVDSHGVARLSGYVRLWEAGRINSNPNIKIIHEKPSTATIDADAAMGLVATPYAMNIAIKKAKTTGTGWVAIKNSNHFGIAGYHSILATKHDCIGIATTNASPLVAPTRAKERMLGTNPFAFAIPTNKQPTFVADFSTSSVANGKLEILQRQNKQCASDLVQNKDGQQTNDPAVLKKGGALLPLGSNEQHGSHKGYCMSAVSDILSGVLSGAAFGPFVPPFVDFLPLPSQEHGQGIGHFIGAISIDGFQSANTFKSKMDAWIERFRQTTPIDTDNPVVIPGDPERLATVERKKNGVPINTKIWDDLQKLSEKFNIPMPQKL